MNLDIQSTTFTKASDVVIPDIFYNRIKTGYEEVDVGFGGGLLPGSTITLTARAGCGKTTFLLQLFESLSKKGYNVAYASGEENLYQLAFNCKRLNVTSVNIANETDVDMLVRATEKYDALVVDSFQALTTEDDMNSRQHEKFAIESLVNAAKLNECVVFFVLHLTKAGVLKGGAAIPHTVDVNMQIDIDPEGVDSTARVITITKNRFGPCMEYSSLMTEQGFIFTGVREYQDKSLTKKQRLESNSDKVLKMEGDITKQRVIKELGLTPSQAYILLKGMSDSGLIYKVGRGDEAYYELASE